MKVVEGGTIATENEHIEVRKGSGSGVFGFLHTAKPFLSQIGSQTGSLSGLGIGLVWFMFENPKTVQA